MGPTPTAHGATHLTFHPRLRLDTPETFSELALGSLELCKGARQMLHLIIQLLLDLAQLLSAQAVEVDY